MDGNRRWATQQGLNILKGHEFVVENVVENLIERCGELGIPYLTLWVFSTENWKRDKTEVKGLMQLFRNALKTKVERFIAKGAKLNWIGDIGAFPQDIQDGLESARKASAHNTKITVTYALNYGGRDEILRAIRYLSPEQAKNLTEEQFGQLLDTKDLPDPDLIIRTGGEKRMSGFMAWQATYAEYYFTDTLMPDFTPEKLEEAIDDYQQRRRRFGK